MHALAATRKWAKEGLNSAFKCERKVQHNMAYYEPKMGKTGLSSAFECEGRD